MFFWLIFLVMAQAPYLAVDVPGSLAQVLLRVGYLEPSAPDVLDGVAQVERQVLDDVDALDTGRVRGVVRRVVDGVRSGC